MEGVGKVGGNGRWKGGGVSMMQEVVGRLGVRGTSVASKKICNTWNRRTTCFVHEHYDARSEMSCVKCIVCDDDS